jgi:phosphonate transport system substrate-binding protein
MKNGYRISSSLVIVSWLLSFVIMFGCQKQSDPPAEPELSDAQPLRIGLIPEYDIFSQKKRYEPLINYLAEKAGIRIELKIITRYGNIIDNFKAERLEGAFLGSFTGALAIRKLEVEPLARPELADGTSTYYGMVFVRKDSGINTAADMKGKRFAFVDKATTAGWLLPLYFFHESGIKNYCAWFREWYFTGTHEGAIYDVLDRRADVGAAKNTVFDRLAEGDERIKSELQILTTSPRVSENAFVVRRGMEENLRMALKNALLQMSQDPKGRQVLQEFGAVRFIETTIDDYAPVFKFADQIGLNLDTYDYINE